ncbi:MAG: hypothetical protein ACYDER_03820 [Ktedonobacteraceae bacterium]
MKNLKNAAFRITTQPGGKENWGNTITVTLRVIALSTHLILIPLLIRELYQEFVHGQKHENTLFQK